jgi:hypothetical protein
MKSEINDNDNNSIKMVATTKKKQKLVKHKRKNWSKTNIDDVERGIDDLRHQKLTGYSIFII